MMREKRPFCLLPALLISFLLTASQVSGQTGKTRTFNIAEGVIEIPVNYKVEQVSGPDFGVDYVYSDEAGAKERAVLGEYVGDFPGFHPPQNARIRKLQLGNRKIKWYIWHKQQNNKTLYIYEALIKYGIGQGVSHLFVSGTDQKEVQKLFAVFQTYRKIK